jgi:broad specificity phosphatase PhoE
LKRFLPAMSDEMGNWIALIRHGAPAIDPGVSPEQWGLSIEGRSEVAALGAHLQQLNPSVVLCSPELKARQTAQLIYPRQAIQIDERLREQGLGQTPLLSTGAFRAAVLPHRIMSKS